MLPAAFNTNDASPLDRGDGLQFVRRPDNVASDNDAVSAAAAAARSNSASFPNGKGSFGVVGGGEKKSKHAEASDVHVGPTTLSATRLARLRVAAQEEKAQRQPWRSTEKSSLQRPKPPQASNSFRQILAANKTTTPSSENVVAPFCVDDEKDAKSVARTTTSPRSHAAAAAAAALKSPLNTREFSPEPIPESSFSPSSSEFASVKRTDSVSSIGSGSAGRLRGLTSSFLRRLRGTSVKRFEDEGGGGGGKVTPSKALAQTHIDQRGKRITTSTQLVASLIDHERSRGLYKESSDASVTSFHGTTEEEEESVESIAGADTPSSFDQASSTSVQPRLSDSSLSLRSSSGARGLVHKSSTDLPVIQGSPPDERPPPKRTVARAQQRSDKLRDRRTYSHDSQRTPLASDHGHGMPSTTTTTTNDRAGNGGGGGGWRSRFGSSRRSEKAADVQSITSEANVQQREAAVQHISRQQRSAKGIKDRTKAESMPGSPHSRLDAYRKATGVVAAATAAATTSSPALSKAERMMGSGAFAVVQEDVTKTHREFNASGGNKDDADCPVCLEPLSFRLAGEKKHVVPQCGHALHHACFTAVYGAPELVHAAQASGKRNAAPGMCGVCRKLIVLPAIEQGPTDDVGAKGKAKSMMGLSNADRRESEEDFKGNWQTGRSAAGENGGGADDPIHGNAYDHRSAAAAASSTHKGVQGTLSIAKTDADRSSDSSMVLPIVHVRPEFETIVRTKRPSNRTNGGETQNVVCVVSVQVPPRRRRLRMEEDEQLWRQKCDQYSLLAAAAAEKKSSGQVPGNQDDEIEGYVDDERPETEPAEITEKIEPSSPSSASSEEEGFSYGATPAATSNKTSFRVAIDDLKNRVIDWKGHSVDKFGELIVFDFLGVRQDTVMREFHVYLFREALLCVSEERKKERGLVRLINATTSSSQDDTSSGSSTSRTGKTAMKLKGRIWIRHIRHCQELDVDGSPCLSIRLDDEALDHFVLCFKEHGVRKSWKSKLTRVLKDRRAAAAAAATTGARPSKDKVAGGDEVSLSSRRDTMNELPSPVAAAAISKDGSYGSLTTSSSVKQTAAGGGGGTMPSSDSKSTTLNSPTTSSVNASPSSVIAAAAHGQPKGLRNRPSVATMPDFLTNLPQHQQWSASGGLDPTKPVPSMLPHTPLDLIVMVSVPSVTVQPAVSSTTISSSAALKLRLIRSTLDFVIANVGARDRIALVAYNVGNGGAIRRTALLNANKTASRERLELFVESIGKPWEGPGEDPFEESFDDVGGMGERTDTVTAINVGFDIVLQRKTKNPTTSMLLINDTADAPKRGQMDLIMARGEAANVPVHCFGFGKSHDPSSLWLISNHTRGSYTFVKEWYQLRECVAGCLGALMSIALTDVKIHVCVPSDNHFRVRRVTGCTGTIVSSSGKDVDLTIGELRFGGTKELLLELELDFGALLAEREANRERAVTALGANGFEHGSATDDFMQRLGLEGLSIAEARQRPINVKRMFYKNSTNGSEVDAEHGAQEGLDEVAVLEVHCGCRDPHVGMTKHQIGDPCVLTMEVDCSGNIKEDEDDRMSTVMADPTVTRRRLEILVSDMITRSLLLVSRGNNAQALQILLETRKIVDTVLRTVPLQAFEEDSSKARRSSLVAFQTQAALYATQTRNSHARKQRQLLHRRTALSLIAITEDLDVLIDGLEMSKAVSFERSERNFGAQQAMVLRDQKAWTSRSDTEWLFYSMLDNGPTFAALAAQHAARYSL